MSTYEYVLVIDTYGDCDLRILNADLTTPATDSSMYTITDWFPFLCDQGFKLHTAYSTQSGHRYIFERAPIVKPQVNTHISAGIPGAIIQDYVDAVSKHRIDHE